MKKIFIAFLALIGVVCMGLSVACNKTPVYHILTYYAQDGVTLDFGDILSGAEVKDGYEVHFTVTFEDAVEGPRTVTANGSNLEESAEGEGSYSFVMKEDTNITVNAWLPNDYTVTFDKDVDSDWVWFFDENGNEYTEEQPLSCQGGDVVSFSVKTSVYYGDSKFTITANTMILSPDDNGFYKFSVTDDTTVNIRGLELDSNFLEREDGGVGSEEDPYIIERPIDLYAIAYLLEGTFDTSFSSRYFKMNADIDMKGEHLYIIGEYPEENSTALFSGHFDGNGHKISNYYIEDYIVDQSTGVQIPLGNVGLFGVCSATTNSNVTISNLTLEDFEIRVDGTKLSDSGFFVGGIVGLGLGVEITNCSVSGTITAYGNSDYFGYVGGVIGRQMSFYGGDSLMYYSSVQSCSSDVEIDCPTGNVYAAGGITGWLSSGDESVNAYVVNCYSTGNVSGAICTGGIVGYAGVYTSVANCYSTGEIAARSRTGLLNGSDIYGYAYGGGIVGNADNDTVVYNCFSTAFVSASSSLGGTGYAFSDKILGGSADVGLYYIDSKATVSLDNKEAYSPELGWSADVWDFSGAYPVLKAAQTVSGLTLRVEYVGGSSVGGNTSAQYSVSPYTAISDLYRNDLPRFVTSDTGSRSFGYFFDENLSKPVPYAFVPTRDITVYAGFADYSLVAGTYYLNRNSSNDIVLQLNADGTFSYREGALGYETEYTFDGKTITLAGSPATTVSIAGVNNDGTASGTSTTYYVPAIANYSANSLVFVYALNGANNSSVTAVKEIDFAFGSYYAEGGDDYTFNKNGTGVRGVTAFTYTVSGNDITVKIGTTTVLGEVTSSGLTLDGVSYARYDDFAGYWDKSATTNKQYYFDGKGGWTFNYFVYDENGNRISVEQELTGSYTPNGDKIVLDNGVEVSFNADGFLDVKYPSYTEVYYRESSYVGKWSYFNVQTPVTLTFGGINGLGYGDVEVQYGVSAAGKSVMAYECIATSGGNNILIYDGDQLVASLVYSVANGTLTGSMLNTNGSLINGVVFCLYDDFEGSWYNETLGAVSFNGLGSYDMAGTANYTKTVGTAKFADATVQYKLSLSLAEGELTYNKVTYLISYDETTDTVVMSEKDGEAQYVFERNAAV